MLGCKLRLHDLDDSRLADIRARGGIDVDGQGGGFAAIERVTTDLATAVEGADIIIIVTGGNAQETVAGALAPLLRDGQIILLIQGNTGGSLVFRRTLDAASCRAAVEVFELSVAGPDSGNPFTKVQLGARFVLGRKLVTVDGFYDDMGTYKVRFMPDTAGEWT